MGFERLSVGPDFVLRMDEAPLNSTISVNKIEWIGRFDGVWKMNIITQFGWMNFSDVEVTKSKGSKYEFDGSKFSFGQLRVSIDSTFQASNIRDYGITIGDWSETDALRPTLQDALSGPLFYLLDSDYRQSIQGGNLDDWISLGFSGGEVFASGGNDFVQGSEGNDTIFGGDGNDTLKGGDGNDEISGSDGLDILKGGRGNDTIWSGTSVDKTGGDSEVYGGAGDDTIYGEIADESFFGDDGDDFLWGNTGNDTLSGGKGNDSILGGEGSDTIYGGGDSDSIRGGEGSDTIYGGNGNDTLWPNAGRDNVVFGDAGNDTIWGSFEHDTFFGGKGNDYLFGEDGRDVLTGGKGNDTLVGSMWTDTLYGGKGADFLYAGEETSFVDSKEKLGLNILFGGAGRDNLYSWTADETTGDTLTGGAGKDSFWVNNADYITDFSQNDTINMLNSGSADQIFVVVRGSSTKIKFIDKSFATLAEIELDGRYNPSDFTASSLGGLSTIKTTSTQELGRAKKVEIGNFFAEPFDTLIDDLQRDGFTLVASGLADFISDKMAEKNGLLATLSASLGKSAAKLLKEGIVNVAFTAGQQLAGEFDDKSDDFIALQYIGAAGFAVVGTFAAGTVLAPLVVPLTLTAAFGPSIVEAAIDLYFEYVKQKILNEADPENIESSVIYKRFDMGLLEEKEDDFEPNLASLDYDLVERIGPEVLDNLPIS